MKARVSERPYLFEQVKQVSDRKPEHYFTSIMTQTSTGLTLSFYWQKNAKAHAEQIYRNKLKKAGLKEQFVEENAEAVEGVATSSRSWGDRDLNNCSADNDLHNRYEA